MNTRIPSLPAKYTRVALLLALALTAFPHAVRAQNAPTASAVLANVLREFDRVNDYSAELLAIVNMPGVKVPPMKAKIWFKKPDRMHLETDGFAMLPRDAVSFNPRVFSEDLYDAVLQGEETAGGVRCLKLKLLAKSDTLRLQRALLSVDPVRWLILRMVTDPAQGGSAEIGISYAYLDNKYFLPSKIELRMQASAIGHRGQKPGIPAAKAGKEDQKQQTAITLTYSNYAVNKGIRDELFDRGKEKKP